MPLIRRRAIFTAALSLGLCGAVLGQAGVRSQEAKPPAAAPAAIDSNARALVDRMSAAHRALRSFSGTVEVRTKAEGLPDTETLRSEILFKKPDRALVLSMSDPGRRRHAVADGKHAYAVSSDYPTRYHKRALTARSPSGVVLALSFGTDKRARTLLLGGGDAIIDSATSLKMGPPGEVAGAPVETVIGTARWEDEVVRFTLAIGRSDRLLRRYTWNGMGNGRPMTVTITFSQMKANPALPDALFTFAPTPGAKPVTPTAARP